MKRILTFALCLLLMLSVLSGCGVKKPAAGTQELPHFNGILTTDIDGTVTGDGTYDSDLLAKPDNYVWGADNGVIYVSAEEAEAAAAKHADSQGLTGDARTAYINSYTQQYGGYFYMYSGYGNTKHQSVQVHADGSYSLVLCYRSENLYDWEPVGPLDSGWCLSLSENSWIYHQLWAPEVIHNPEDGKYYMYFGAQAKTNDGSIAGATYESYDYYTDNFYSGVACSDSPIGPFYMVTSDRNYNEGTNPLGETLTEANPTINWVKNLGIDGNFPVIDFHPVWLDDGDPETFDLYLYFVRHRSSLYTWSNNDIWGVRMLDMATPDYSTLRKVIGAGFEKTVTYIGGNPALAESYELSYFEIQEKENDSYSVCEAPFMLTTEVDGKTKYLLLSSPKGVTHVEYNVDISIADDPLGPYTKLELEEGREMLASDVSNDYVSNLGHCAVVKAGDEYYCCYGTAESYGGDVISGRYNRVDQMGWYYEESIGCNLPVVNGPTCSLQALPAISSGYSNVAQLAAVSGVNVDKNTLEYLTDGIVPTQERLTDMETVTTADEASITFSFDTPVTLRGILVYNSYRYSNAFKKIDYITFELAEAVNIDGTFVTTVAIQDLPFDSSYVDFDRVLMRSGSASVATFDAIKVKSVTVTVGTLLDSSAGPIHIGEIVLLGREG